MPKKITRKIPPGFKPARLDTALHELKIFLSRSQAKRAIEEGLVTVDGAEAKPKLLVKEGDVIEAFIPDPKPAIPESENIPLKIIYEDLDIVVIDKPPGIVTHPGAGVAGGTLVNAVLFHCRGLSGIGGVQRPGVVHRLDKDTSGVIAMAKNDAAHLSLSKQFHDRTVEKIYLAIILGKMPKPSGTIDSSIARNPKMRTKMKGGAADGRKAATEWKVIEAFDGASLISLKPLTGRTHQIRVHLSEMGRPVAGDKTYGDKNRIKSISNTSVRAALSKLDRQALHAHRLTVNHPRTGERMIFISPLPDDMKTVLEEIGNAG